MYSFPKILLRDTWATQKGDLSFSLLFSTCKLFLQAGTLAEPLRVREGTTVEWQWSLRQTAENSEEFISRAREHANKNAASSFRLSFRIAPFPILLKGGEGVLRLFANWTFNFRQGRKREMETVLLDITKLYQNKREQEGRYTTRKIPLQNYIMIKCEVLKMVWRNMTTAFFRFSIASSLR